MPRRPHPATATSTLHRAPVEAGAAEDTDDGVPPEVDEAAAAGYPPAGDAGDGYPPEAAGDEAAPPEGSSEPPAQAAAAEAPRRGRGRPARPRAATPATPAPAPAPAQEVALTDAELADLGALTRMCLKFRVPLEAFVPELERMIAAYRKAEL